MAIWGALIGAAASAYSANRSANAQADAARSANALDLGTFREGNDFNRAEADKARWFNAEEAEKARAFSASSAAEAQQFSAGQADIARNWEKMMSDTSYQRAVGDMKSAGLNPMLAYSQGGASTPGSPSASGIAASAPSASSGSASSGSAPRATPAAKFGNAELIANTASSFLDIERKLAEVNAIKASTDKTKSDTTGSDWNNKLKENEWKYQLPMLHEKLDQMMSESAEKDFAWKMREKLADVEEKKRRGELTEQQARIEAIKLGNEMTGYGREGAQNQQAFERQMQSAPQYLKMITGILNAAQGARNLGK